MTYATTDDLQTRLGPLACVQLTDDENQGTADLSRLREALDAAQGEIDSRLSCRYAVPVDVADQQHAAALLRAVTCDLAIHRLHARRPPVPDAVRDAAVNARQWLRDLVHGRAHLPTAHTPAETASTGLIAQTAGRGRVQWDG